MTGARRPAVSRAQRVVTVLVLMGLGSLLVTAGMELPWGVLSFLTLAVGGALVGVGVSKLLPRRQ